MTPWSVGHTILLVHRYNLADDEAQIHISHALHEIREGARIGDDTVQFDNLHRAAIFHLRDRGFDVIEPDPTNPVGTPIIVHTKPIGYAGHPDEKS